jgi:hypothetical protein
MNRSFKALGDSFNLSNARILGDSFNLSNARIYDPKIKIYNIFS